MQSAALGADPPVWMKKYAVDNLRFVEFERKALPCALMRGKAGYTYSAADMDARSVMEQRLQSMVCAFSMVQQVLSAHKAKFASAPAPASAAKQPTKTPLVPYMPAEAIDKVWTRLARIPQLLEDHLLAPAAAQLEAALVQLAKEVKEAKEEPTASLVTSASASASSPRNAASTSSSSSSSISVVSISPEDQAQQQAATATTATATTTSTTGAAATLHPAQALVNSRSAAVEAIKGALSTVRSLLAAKPLGLTRLRETCMAVRAALKKIEHTATPRARLVPLLVTA
jgi:hypothetical protein